MVIRCQAGGHNHLADRAVRLVFKDSAKTYNLCSAETTALMKLAYNTPGLIAAYDLPLTDTVSSLEEEAQ